MIRVPVVDVLQQENQQYTVMFLQKEAQKVMGLWVGFLEGLMIAWLANGAPWVWAGSRRPLTFNLLGKILLENGIFLRDVQIVSEEEEVFYALTRLRTPKGDCDLDCRPSDAVALALQMKRPIFVDPEVMDPVTWKLSDVYKGKAAPGDVMRLYPEALETMWQEKDSRAVSNVALKTNIRPSVSDQDAPPVRLTLADIREKDEMSNIVVLMDGESLIALPILMPSWEGYFLASLIHDQMDLQNPGDPHRPNTIDYAVNLLSACDISVEEIVIHSERGGVLHASIAIRTGEKQMTLDARPYDAIVLALKFDLPIYASAVVMEAAGLSWRKLYRSREAIGRGIEKIARENKVQVEQPTLVGRLKSLFRK